MNLCGLDTDVDSHEFAICKLFKLSEYRRKSWKVIGIVPTTEVVMSNKVAFVLVRKKVNNFNPCRNK